MCRIAFWFLLIAECFSCTPNMDKKSPNSSNQLKTFDYSKFKLESGDILFQDSDCGPFCESIEKVSSGIQGSKFSHVGMIVTNEKDQLVILEAVTKGVVETPLDSFFIRSFDADNNSKVVVGRIKKEYRSLIPLAIKFAKTKIGIPYDEKFDILNDT